MTAVVNANPGLASRLINGILAIKPLADLLKQQARNTIVKRAERMGVPWRQQVQALREVTRSPDGKPYDWETSLAQIQNPKLTYPDYYLRPFHAYDTGNLSWQAAFEVEPAAYAVHARIWPNSGIQGDTKLRQTYHEILKTTIPTPPQDIVDLGCSVGMSTFALQEIYPQANLTGVDLSPYFLAVARYRAQERRASINWVHAAAESTGLPDASFDLVSTFLTCHELPQSATRKIFQEARRLLRPNGYLAIMDMNPKSEAFAKMPPYVFTLLKSTEPYLDEYFTLDIEQALIEAGFNAPTITANSPRHRTIIAKVNTDQ